MVSKYYSKNTKFRRYRRKRIPRVKKLVTGQTQPTMLEKIASGMGGVASVAKAVLPMITAINTERKYIDQIASQTIPIGSPMLQPLTLIAQGTDESNRIGNSILAQDLNIRFSIIPNYGTDPYNLIRFIIFADKQQSGTAPTVNQLFTTPANIDSPFNRNYTDRFVIIKDKRLVIAQQGDQHQIFHKVYKKLNFHVRYIGTGPLASSLGNNAIYFYAVSTQVTTPPTASIYSRINFTDN